MAVRITTGGIHGSYHEPRCASGECRGCDFQYGKVGGEHVKPFPFSAHRGDRELARTLLYEHGMDTQLADLNNPEVIEALAGQGRLTETTLYEADRRWRDMAVDRFNDWTPWRHTYAGSVGSTTRPSTPHPTHPPPPKPRATTGRRR